MPLNPLTDTNTNVRLNVERFILECANAFRNQRQQAINRAKFVWANPNGFTPEQVLEAMGTRAAALFSAHADLVAIIAKIDDTILTELAEIIKPTTVHEDGTVTVA